MGGKLSISDIKGEVKATTSNLLDDYSFDDLKKDVKKANET